MPSRTLIMSFLLGASVVARPALAATPALAAVSVNNDSLGRAIPSDFDGFSIEVDDAANKYLGLGSSPNRVFYQLLKNLGRSTIRIGGDSSDYSCWKPNEAPHPSGCQFTITQDVLNGSFKASSQTGWGLIIGVNLAQNDPSWALQYGIQSSNTAQSVSASKLLAFEFGNEPDLYSSEIFYDDTTIRPNSYSWQGVVSDWSAYVQAFKSNPATENVPLVGPAYDDSTDAWRNSYLRPFIDGVGASSLGVVTVHEYPTDTCDSDTVTIPELLAPSLISSYISMASGWVTVTHNSGLPLEIGETNSTACGGKHGVDDVFAATAWGLDWLFTNFNLGIRRINFHMDGAFYSAVHVYPATHPDGSVTYRNRVEPLYYAMYAFSTLAQGRHTLHVAVSSGANITAYAVRSSSTGPVTVFVINKDLGASGTVAVNLSTSMGKASLLVVRAPTLTSNAVSYGGVKFDNKTGRLTGTPQKSTVNPDSAGTYSFDLRNASIAILTINP